MDSGKLFTLEALHERFPSVSFDCVQDFISLIGSLPEDEVFQMYHQLLTENEEKLTKHINLIREPRTPELEKFGIEVFLVERALRQLRQLFYVETHSSFKVYRGPLVEQVTEHPMSVVGKYQHNRDWWVAVRPDSEKEAEMLDGLYSMYQDGIIATMYATDEEYLTRSHWS